MQFTAEQINTRLEAHRNSEVFTEPATLSAELLMDLRGRLPEEKRASAYILIDSKAYQVFVHDEDLLSLFDPISLHSAVAAGHLGVLFGMDMLTDAFHYPDKKVLPTGRVYVMAADGTEGYGTAVII